MVLKPQDIVIALKVLTLEDAPWTQRLISASLGLSLSEVNGGLKRAVASRLLSIQSEGRERAKPNLISLEEFLLHGISYAFPPNKGPSTRGIPTGFMGPDLKKHISQDGEGPVWPYAKGKVRGYALEPLYPSLPEAMQKPENEPLYRILALVDAIREGRKREKQVAEGLLKRLLRKEVLH